MARARKAGDRPAAGKRRIEQYDHKGQRRKNNPPVGLVTEATDRDAPRMRYVYDPHLDPALTWAGKAEHTSFEVPTVSYLTYLRDRLLLARELLHESGSCFVQISDENVHLVRDLMDEVFGVANHVVTIVVKKKGSQKSGLLDPVNDYLVWYSRSPRGEGKVAFRPLFEKREFAGETLAEFRMVELRDGREYPISAVPDLTAAPRDYRLNPRQLFRDHPGARIFRPWPITNGGQRTNQQDPIDLNGRTFTPPAGRCWSHTSRTSDGSPSGMDLLKAAGRLIAAGRSLDAKRYLDDFPFKTVSNWWDALGGAADPIYVVQTNTEILKRCILMTTDPGDLVFDPTCGSGTTAYVAEQWGRRWITCDTSRVSVTLAKQRLMTAAFDYYALAHPAEGVGSGFVYKTVPHVTLKSIANNEPPGQETLYDQPRVDGSRVRVTGPFTVEAVPAPAVRPLGEVGAPRPADASVARSGETLRQAEWRAELLKTGIRGKNNQMILFSRVEPLAGTRWLHADAESLPNDRGADRVSEPRPGPARSADRVVVSFGPEHAPLEQRQVELAWEEARTLSPRPGILAFAAFQFDPEAAKDIDELTREKTGMTFLKVQMNPDLLTEDLKKKRASNESFWLVGQPDVEVRAIGTGEHAGKLEVEVHGFDYYNTKTGQIESGDTRRIALWMLDPDYDGRSLFPRQVFFPMADESGGWARLARNLRAEIDEERIEAYRGTVSLPFEPGPHRRVAVKIVDDRGIESLRIIPGA
jgi:adenine-specific DNA-methyltransferase